MSTETENGIPRHQILCIAALLANAAHIHTFVCIRMLLVTTATYILPCHNLSCDKLILAQTGSTFSSFDVNCAHTVRPARVAAYFHN